MSTILNKTLEGISWNFKSQILTQGINFIVGLLLMRWLVPNDFGLFAMVLVVVSFLQIFRSAGLTVALIQKKELDEISLSTAFWFQIILSFLIGIPLLLSGELFNSFYEENSLGQISFWLSIDFFLGAIGAVPTTLLRKELKFKELFKIQFLGVIVSSSCAIIMAINGFGYLSLIGKLMSWTVITSFGTFMMVKWKPKFQLSKTALQSLLGIGLPDTGNHVLSYLVRNTDDFFIGRVIGASSLGFYNRAYIIMLLPMINITSVLQTVLFSTWSKMQDDIEGIKRMYIKVSGMIALIAFPFMTLLAVLAEPIVITVFGATWQPMANTLSILSLIGMFQSVSSLLGVIFIVLNQNNLLFKITVVTSIITIIVTIGVVYIYKSIEITALSYGIVSLVLLYPVYFYASKIMDIPFKELIKPMGYPFIFSLIIGAFGGGVFYYLPFESIFLNLFISTLLSLLLYLFLCVFFKIRPIAHLSKAINYYRFGTNE